MNKLKIILPIIVILLFYAGVFIGLFFYSKDVEELETDRVSSEIRAINSDNTDKVEDFFDNEMSILEITSRILSESGDPLFVRDTDGGTGLLSDGDTVSSADVSLDGVMPTPFAFHCLDQLLTRGMNYLALANPDGRYYLNEYEGVTDVVKSIAEQEFFKQSLTSAETKIDYIISTLSHRGTLVASCPVIRDGRIVASIIVNAYQDTLTDVMGQASEIHFGFDSTIINQNYENITQYKNETIAAAVKTLREKEAASEGSSVIDSGDIFIFAGGSIRSRYLISGQTWRVVTVTNSESMLRYYNMYTTNTNVLVGIISVVCVAATTAFTIIFSLNMRNKYALETKQKMILSKFKKYNFEFHPKTDTIFFGPETRALIGLNKSSYKFSELVNIGVLYPSAAEDTDRYEETLRKNGEVKFEIELRNSKHLRVEMYHLVSEKQKIDDYFGFIEDVTAFAAKQRLLEKQAMTDGLTKLKNRETAIAEINKNIQQSPHDRKALYIIDIDKFKQINDHYGHYVGDIVLQKVANALGGLAYDHDLLIGRMGGDEFCLFADKLPKMEDVRELGNLICNKLSMLTISDEIDYFIECSVGISVFPRNGMDFNELYQCADNALYEAKNIFGSGYVLYGGGVADSEKSVKEAILQISAETKEDNYSLLLSHGEAGAAKLKGILTEAIKQGEFVSYKQPLISCRDAAIAAEALARWKNPVYGLMNPNKFILLFERSKSIELLDNHILDCTFEEIASRLAQGKPAVNISVNQSVQTILQPNYLNRVSDNIKKYPDAAQYITVEITERGLFTGLRSIIKVINRLHEFGFKIAIDDFGSGNTTLSILNDLAVDEIKLDKSFMNKNGKWSEKSKIIIRQIISMAHELGIEVVAEGVETYEQAAFLIAAGTDWLQGFYIGKGMSAENFYSRLDNDDFVSVEKIAKFENRNDGD